MKTINLQTVMQEIKQNWKGYITIANMILIMGFVISQSRWQQKVDSHLLDTGIHMSIDNKYKTFMSRSEIEIHLQSIREQNNKIEGKLDRIYNLMYESE